MEFIRTNITLVITALTLLSHVVLILGGLVFVVEEKFRALVYRFVNKYILLLLFGASLSALIGSLAYSNIIGFPPCELCWIQRIFMYPQVLLSGVALWRKDKNIVTYLLSLSVLGGIVALYHSLTHLGIGDGVVGCTSALGDCGKLYVHEYGYITIPLMSFTVFTYLILLSIIYLKSERKINATE